jgi:arabinoxylan arabinofuranohydrolase
VLTPAFVSAITLRYDPPTEIRDPGVLHDPTTDEYYIVFGTFNYYIAKLGDDMVSLAETPRYVTVEGVWAGQNGPNKTDDKPFLHVFNGT